MLIRYRRSDKRVWWKTKVAGTNVTVSKNVDPCATYKFQLKAKVVGRSGIETLSLDSRVTGPGPLAGLKTAMVVGQDGSNVLQRKCSLNYLVGS